MGELCHVGACFEALDVSVVTAPSVTSFIFFTILTLPSERCDLGVALTGDWRSQEGCVGGTRGYPPLSIQNLHPPLAQIYTPPPKPLKSHPPLIFTNLTSQERN